MVIMDISKCSRLLKWDQADSEPVYLQEIETTKVRFVLAVLLGFWHEH